jgi:3-hydroxymyristoyl/3-hydroxydecanoyl-(acyl carrier protein) dehydratase
MVPTWEGSPGRAAQRRRTQRTQAAAGTYLAILEIQGLELILCTFAWYPFMTVVLLIVQQAQAVAGTSL